MTNETTKTVEFRSAQQLCETSDDCCNSGTIVRETRTYGVPYGSPFGEYGIKLLQTERSLWCEDCGALVDEHR